MCIMGRMEVMAVHQEWGATELGSLTSFLANQDSQQLQHYNTSFLTAFQSLL